MSFTRHVPSKGQLQLGLVWLLLATGAPIALALEPRQQVQQALYSLGVHGLFASLQPLLERELQHYQQQGFEIAPDAAAVQQALDAVTLQSQLEALLLRNYDAQLYTTVIDALSQEQVTPVIQSCHGQALQDHGPQLQAYEEQMAQQPARVARRELAVELDQSARTSQLAAQLHSALDQLLYRLADKSTADIRWDEVEAERVAALQPATVVWYLYCGRFYPDDQLQATAATYQIPAVNRLLDKYQRALDEVMASTADSLVEVRGDQ